MQMRDLTVEIDFYKRQIIAPSNGWFTKSLPHVLEAISVYRMMDERGWVPCVPIFGITQDGAVLMWISHPVGGLSFDMWFNGETRDGFFRYFVVNPSTTHGQSWTRDINNSASIDGTDWPPHLMSLLQEIQIANETT